MAAVRARPQASGNLRKHTSHNPLQRLLLRRFHDHIAALAAQALQGSGDRPVVVEVGCGEGFVLAALQRSLPALLGRPGGVRLAGLDLRLDALAVAAGLAPGAGLARAEALHLPLPDGAADVALCLEVLEHLPDPWPAVAELRRVARRAVLVSVPDQPWFALANLARGKNLPTWGDDPEHLHHWRGGTFVRLLERRIPVERVQRSFPWVIAVCRGSG